jgi:hypothetical protein
MAKLYAQHVLKEQPTIQIQGLGGKKKSDVQEVLHKPQVYSGMGEAEAGELLRGFFRARR